MVGVHAGEYTQEAGKPQCFFSKTCPDCHKYLSKSEHVFDEWHYTGPDWVHSCIHCNTEESKVEHDYQEQSKDAECKIFKVCSHCKDKQYVKETHAYEGSEQVQCDVFKVCKDCGHKKADGKNTPTKRRGMQNVRLSRSARFAQIKIKVGLQATNMVSGKTRVIVPKAVRVSIAAKQNL
ncbi:hypothetical protein HHE06_15470 [Helicobacter heilmannii]|nr:hypothetical protein HHE06_15470 [Helicobacter heilmannii]